MGRNLRKMNADGSGDKDVRSMFISCNGHGYASSESLSDSTESSSDGDVMHYSYSEFSDSETSDDNCSKSHFDNWSRRRRDSRLNKGGYLSKLSRTERKHPSEFAGDECGSARFDDTFESKRMQNGNPSESTDNASEVGQDKYSIHRKRIDSVDESTEAKRNMCSLDDEIRENKRKTSVHQDESENTYRSENTRNFRDQWKGTESSHSQYQKEGKTYEDTIENLSGVYDKDGLDPIFKEEKKLQSSSSSATSKSNNWYHTKAKRRSDSSRSQAKRNIPILRNKTSGDGQDLRNIGKKSCHNSKQKPSSRSKSQSQNIGRQRLPKYSISSPKEAQNEEEKRERQSQNQSNLGTYAKHHSAEMQSTKPPSRKVKKPQAMAKLESEECIISPITDMRKRDSSIQEMLQDSTINLTKNTQSKPKQDVNMSIKEKTQTFQTSDQNKQDSEAKSEASSAPFQEKSQTSSSICNKTHTKAKVNINNSIQDKSQTSLSNDEKKSDLRDKSDFSVLEKSQTSSLSKKKKTQKNKSNVSHSVQEKSRTSQATDEKKSDTKKGFEEKKSSSMRMSLTSLTSDKKKLSSKERGEQKSSNTEVHHCKEIPITMQTTEEKKKIESRHSPEKASQHLKTSSTTYSLSDNSEAGCFAGRADPIKKPSIHVREKSTSNFFCIQRQPKVVGSQSKSSSCKSQESRNDDNCLMTNKINKSSLFNNKQCDTADPSLKRYTSEIRNLSKSPIVSGESNESADVSVVLRKDKKSTPEVKIVSSLFNNSSQALAQTTKTSYDSTPDPLLKTLDAAEDAIELQFQRHSPKKKIINNIKRIFPSVRKRPKDEHKHDFGLVTIIVESPRT